MDPPGQHMFELVGTGCINLGFMELDIGQELKSVMVNVRLGEWDNLDNRVLGTQRHNVAQAYPERA